MTKATWEGKGLFVFYFQITVHTEGSQDRSLEAGADGKAMKGCCLLARSLWLAQPAFLL